MTIPVALAACPGYDRPSVERAVEAALAASGFSPARGEAVLVKPNLLRAKALACTHPELVRAACRWCLDHGARVAVGDSPAFGAGPAVARRLGYSEALKGLDVELIHLDGPRAVNLPGGVRAMVSGRALDADRILNLPKLKAHTQMRVTGAVKNLFGTVAGAHKLWAHVKHGDQCERFPGLFLDLAAALPPVHSLLDAVTAMDRMGPSGGDPFQLGLVAASPDPVALDTAVGGVIGLEPQAVPIWRLACERGLPGAFHANLDFPLEGPASFDGAAFRAPTALTPETFHPVRVVQSALRRGAARLVGGERLG